MDGTIEPLPFNERLTMKGSKNYATRLQDLAERYLKEVNMTNDK